MLSCHCVLYTQRCCHVTVYCTHKDVMSLCIVHTKMLSCHCVLYTQRCCHVTVYCTHKDVVMSLCTVHRYDVKLSLCIVHTKMLSCHCVLCTGMTSSCHCVLYTQRCCHVTVYCAQAWRQAVTVYCTHNDVVMSLCIVHTMTLSCHCVLFTQ